MPTRQREGHQPSVGPGRVSTVAVWILTAAAERCTVKGRARFSMQITLPDNPKLVHRAQAAGFTSVEDYVVQLVEKDVAQADVRSTTKKKSPEERVRDFRAFIQSIPPGGNPTFDDRREAMYPDR
jgi:hypothetical protein